MSSASNNTLITQLPSATTPLTGAEIAVVVQQNIAKQVPVSLIAIPGLVGTLTWNPGSISSGASELSPTVTVTGALLGDCVIVGAPYDLQGLTVTGYIDVADSARIVVANLTGSPINLADGEWTVRVIST